eukprot:CAMPEP_0116874408 /NCGR_PEP_ID=MMETSP0463-20121206/5858_1 /TAXON_ID=181622 /ORGANISM="Strombidinopsis sp, Strain SopsisLIS2011" /LENGTH=85 /DNA_ID=CAMNT_0004517999 /DNA_START=519 /DNA_END=776 /DNA_ORIENTATION=+
MKKVDTKVKKQKSDKEDTLLEALSNLEMLVDVIPDLKELKKGIKHMHYREHIVYKIVLDLLGSYLKATERPIYRQYRSKYLTLCE